MKRVYEFILSLLRREAKPSPAAVAEAERLHKAQTLLAIDQAALRMEKAVFSERQSVANLPPNTPWTQQDQSNLKAFLLSASGQRCIRKCRVIEYANAISGCENQLDYTHAAGRTAGCREMITFIVGELAVNFDKPEAEPPVEERHDETVEEFLGRVSP